MIPKWVVLRIGREHPGALREFALSVQGLQLGGVPCGISISWRREAPGAGYTSRLAPGCAGHFAALDRSTDR